MFAQIELPRLLLNPDVTTINGISRADLLDLYGNVSLNPGDNLAGAQRVLDALGPASEKYFASSSTTGDGGSSGPPPPNSLPAGNGAPGSSNVVGNNEVANVSGDNQDVEVTGNGATVNVSGNNATLALYSSGSILSASNATITFFDARANVYGNGNTISLNAGSAIGVFGTNNAITATGNAHVYLNAPGTANSLNTVTASNLSNATATDGEAAGLYLDGGARANLYGNSNTISLNAGSAIGVFGTNNAITATGNAHVYLNAPGTANSLNTVTASNLSNATATDGEAAGLYLDGGAWANVYGSNNSIDLASGSTINIFGSNNNIESSGSNNTYYDTSGDNKYKITSGSSKDYIQSKNSSIIMGENSSLILSGNGNIVNSTSNSSSLYLSPYSSVVYNNNIYISDGNYIYYDGTTTNPFILNSYSNGYINYETFDQNFYESILNYDQYYGYADPNIDENWYGSDDPIVINTHNTDIQTTSIDASHFSFDYSGSGQSSRTGWIDNGESLLVYLNKNNGVSLTGNDLVSTFSTLKQYDTNGDGKISSSDPIWNSLGIWTYNGTSQAALSSDAIPLSQSKIASLDLMGAGTESTFQNGNIIGADHIVTLNDGTQGAAAEVTLKFLTPAIGTDISASTLQASALYDTTETAFDAAISAQALSSMDSHHLLRDFSSTALPDHTISNGHAFDHSVENFNHYAESIMTALNKGIYQGPFAVQDSSTNPSIIQI